MSKTSKIVIVTFLGFFFSVATLEIDIVDYDNTFFDIYDSYVKIDSKVTQKIINVEFDRSASLVIVLRQCYDSHIVAVPFPKEPRSSSFFYRPKLFLIKSSLLI